jgi:hypothetical protein
MASKESNYDKTILAVASILALGVAGYISTLKGGFGDKLVTPVNTPKNQFPEIPSEQAGVAIKNLLNTFNWSAKEFQGKLVPLSKSIPIVLKDGQLFDMFIENPPLRPPMTNQFLRDNDLQYEYANVGDLDPDGDGFSNLEEFNNHTDPKDAKSHPPLTNKLYFKERVQLDYELMLSSTVPPLTVRRTKPLPATSMIPGTPLQEPWPVDFGFERGAVPRFSATAFTTKVVEGKEVNELAVSDKSTGEKFILEFKKPHSLAEYKAVLEFRHVQVQEITVKKGDTFRVNGMAATFKLIDVTEDSATISQLDDQGKPGKPFIINKRP